MQLRQNRGSRPQITFTSDFHELVQGDLIAGPCVLRYDPLRMLEAHDAEHETHQFQAHIRFHPVGSEWQGKLVLPAGMPVEDLADSTGQGLMLTTIFEIPEGCDELEVWFSCTHPDGYTHWDSDHGKNHWLRFGLADLSLKTARVKSAKKNAAQDTLEFEFATKAKVQAVEVRWRITSIPDFPRQITPLVAAAEKPAGKTWTSPEGGIPVPKGATIAFDVVYRVEDREFTDDNQGRWYIAD